MPVVQETLLDPAGRPLADVQIDILLIASDQPNGNAPGYTTDPTAILGRWQTWTDASGAWSVELAPNDALAPPGTYYTLSRKTHGKASNGSVTNEAIIVLDGAGPYSVLELLVEPPSAVPSLHEAKPDPHPQYLTEAEGDADYAAIDHDHGGGAFDVAGAASAAVSSHEALFDPHAGYQKETDKGGANGYPSLDASGLVPDAQIPAGIARGSDLTTAVSTHAGLADPHTGYQKETEKDANSGYAGLDSGGLVPAARLGVSPTATKFLRGDQAWIDLPTAQAVVWRENARAATTANITLSGTQTVDGVALIAGDRILVKDQTLGQNNGIYVVASGAWSRSADADTSGEVNPGVGLFVTGGTLNANKAFALATDNPITLGTTPLLFTQVGGSGSTVPSAALPSNETFGTSGAIGTATDYARGDHTHPMPTDPVTAHAAASDPHPGYLTPAEGNAAYDASGAAASATAAHTATTTNIHGIANTALQETLAGAQAKADAAQASAAVDATAKVATHEADTTAVHGITNTAQIALRDTLNTYTLAQSGPLRDKGGAFFNVMAAGYGITGDGVADERGGLNTLAGLAANSTLHFPPGTYKIASDLSIAANVAVEIGYGAKLAVPNGVTVTINGSLHALVSQIFQCSGTGKVVLLGKLYDIYPEWWGAVGDGVANDGPAINAAIAAHLGPVGSAGSNYTYKARGRVVFTAQYYLTSESISIRSAFNVRLEAAGGPLSSYIIASGIPAAQPGVNHTGGYVLRLEGCYKPEIRNLSFRGDGACGGIKLDGLPQTGRPSQVITPVAGAGTPVNFVGGTTYYIWITYVTGANGETQPQVTAASYVMPGSPNPIQINLASNLLSFGGIRQARFYISTTNDSTTARYVKQSTLDDISTTTAIVTILNPTPIAHPVSGSTNQAPPGTALTGGLVSTIGTFDHVLIEGPLGAGKIGLDIGADRFQADQMTYRRCKFDGQSAKNTGDLVFIHDANAVLHTFEDCMFYASGARGIAIGGTGGSFHLRGCGFTANTDWDWDHTSQNTRGVDISGCWSESSTRFGRVAGTESSVLAVTVTNCSVNGMSDSTQRVFSVEGCARLVVNGGYYKSNLGVGSPAKISMGSASSKRCGVICNGVHFDGNPVNSADLDHGNIQLNECTITEIIDGTVAQPTSGYVPKGSIAVPLLYSTNLNYAAAAWLKIASGTVLSAGVNTFAGVSTTCKGKTLVTVDAIIALGGLTTQAPLILAKDAGANAYTITVLLASAKTLTSDLVFRVSFHPEP